MTLDQLIKYEVGPPVAYAVGALMAVSALVIVTKTVTAGNPAMGWKPATLASRVLDRAFACFFLIRALMIFDGGTISPLVMFLALAGMLREVNAFREYRGSSCRHAMNNVKASRQAYDKLKARGRLPEGAVRP